MRLLLALLLILWTSAAALAERRVALVIADNDYRLIRPLANPVNDGEAMEASLKKLGFEVVLETNRDLRRTRRALDDFREDAKGADVALVYF
ncbi:MAG: peptidase C14, partial [Mesorhizobium sp.]